MVFEVYGLFGRKELWLGDQPGNRSSVQWVSKMIGTAEFRKGIVSLNTHWFFLLARLLGSCKSLSARKQTADRLGNWHLRILSWFWS